LITKPSLRHFHSISFPSEWGLDELNIEDNRAPNFHSISFPSEWGLDRGNGFKGAYVNFHSISFPSEWGPRSALIRDLRSVKFPFN